MKGRFVKILPVLALLVTLVGCNTLSGAQKTPDEQNTVAAPDHLPPQTLKKGECALFLFTTEAPKRFVFFHKQGDVRAKFIDGQRAFELQAGTPLDDLSLMETFEIEYIENKNRYFLSAAFTEALEEGRRLRATLKQRKPDGWEKITPLAGVYACETGE